MLSRGAGYGVAGGLAVFVCEGNTCRSPLAEVLAQQMFGGDASSFLSAGLAAVPGQPAAAGAVRAAADRGLDLTGHRARPLDAALLARARWCIAMTRGQAARLRAALGAAGGAGGGPAVGVLGAPGVDLRAAGPSPACPEIADPWGGDDDTYARTAARIARLLAGWRTQFGGPGADDQGARP